jgi:hypothetical protein
MILAAGLGIEIEHDDGCPAPCGSLCRRQSGRAGTEHGYVCLKPFRHRIVSTIMFSAATVKQARTSLLPSIRIAHSKQLPIPQNKPRAWPARGLERSGMPRRCIKAPTVVPSGTA